MSDTKKNFPVACFAPPLTDESIAGYRAIAEAQPAGPVKDAILACLACVEAWWAIPESARTDGDKFKLRHRGKDVTVAVTPLEESHVAALWEVTPWPYEAAAMRELFTALPTGTREVEAVIETTKGPSKITRAEVVDQAAYDLRNAAMHLVWHVRQLAMDREPITADKL